MALGSITQVQDTARVWDTHAPVPCPCLVSPWQGCWLHNPLQPLYLSDNFVVLQHPSYLAPAQC